MARLIVRSRSFRPLARLALAASLALGVLAPGALAGVEVEITGVSGGVQVKKAGSDEWTDLKEGDKLGEGDVVRLPGSFTWVKWKRIDDGGCGNQGEAGTGLSKVKELEVGKDIRSAAPPAGYFHMVNDGGQDAGSAEITETGNCQGEQHCGISSEVAVAAPMDFTPQGMETHFVGSWEHTPEGIVTTFANAPWSPIPVFSTPLYGPFLDQLIPVFPGQAIHWFQDGTFAFGPWQNPCRADFHGDTVVNSLDVLAFLNAYNARDPRADFNGDGVINSLDVLEFLNAYNAGCN